MAFADSLLKGASSSTVAMLDPHSSPGGQWHDSYGFVQLHQPSASYGVESVAMEPTTANAADHRATRVEVLEYYDGVRQRLAKDYGFEFIGGATLDLEQQSTAAADGRVYTYTLADSGETRTIKVTKRLVDARYLQPDLPINVPPKFAFNADKITCLPINSLMTKGENTTSPQSQSGDRKYVVIGAGKTGMDGVYYLLTKLNVDPANIVWVMPHDPWITARENIGNCMDFLHDAATQHLNNSDCLQATFEQWEKEGKIYRLSSESQPTKFKDATLAKDEVAVLKTIPESNMIRGKGRVAAIQDDGKLLMEDGTVLDLPFATTTTTTYLHCSAGAFNYTRQIGQTPLAVFGANRITIQDVYGTPGFCFVGSILGKLESIPALTDEERNQMCLAPGPSQQPESKLGFTSGDVGTTLTNDHGYVQRLQNLKGWLKTPELRDWLAGHRLFNLGHKSAEEMDQLVEET